MDDCEDVCCCSVLSPEKSMDFLTRCSHSKTPLKVVPVVIHYLLNMCGDTGHERFCSTINLNIGALLMWVCVCIEGMWGTGVSHTAAQPWAGGPAFLLASWIGQSHTHAYMHSLTSRHSVIHTSMPGQIYHFLRVFSTRRPSPNSIHHHSVGFDRWSDTDLIIHVFL